MSSDDGCSSRRGRALLGRARTHISGRSSKHPRRATSSDVDMDADSANEEPTCHLCALDIGETCSQRYHALCFHASCLRAIRNKHNQFKKVPEAREADICLMKKDPPAWRKGTIYIGWLFYGFPAKLGMEAFYCIWGVCVHNFVSCTCKLM
jgi:hypothetical protein